jgi:uracil permease
MATSAPHQNPTTSKPAFALLAIQHVFAMFGATVLVPMLTGLNPGVALISAGVGTLLFHFITGRHVPVFLGSSFAFIGAIIAVGQQDAEKLPYACGGLVVAGLLYVLFSAIVKVVGVDRIKLLFPPVVTGPVIMVIGLHLAPVAVSMASGKALPPEYAAAMGWTPAVSWTLALVAIGTIVLVACFVKGFFKLVPIIMGIAVAYLVAALWGKVDYSAVSGVIANRQFFISGGDFMLPRFSVAAILAIAPIAIATFMEHIGDITTNGAVVGKDFFRKPGLHRTLLGDGIATIMAGCIGAPANTTYSENTGVLAVTQNYNPAIIRLAAVFAIILGVFRPVGSVLQTVPVPVMGGVSFILFGMIAAIGMRTISEAKIDFTHSRNLIIVTLILVTGLARPIADVNSPGIAISVGAVQFSGIGLAAIVGLLANLVLHVILPDNPDND